MVMATPSKKMKKEEDSEAFEDTPKSILKKTSKKNSKRAALSKELKKLPEELMELVDKEESDSDEEITDATMPKVRKPRSIKASEKREKWHGKAVESMKYLLQWKLDR